MQRDSEFNEKESDASLEKGHYGGEHTYAVQADDRYRFDASDLDGVQRKLKQRHVQMIAIAGTIGTGLFLGSGHALAQGGPLGALLAYMLIGTVAFATLSGIGEMTAHAPVSGTFPHFAARWVDPALGFAVGWNYYLANAISYPVELVAATIILGFWDKNTGHQPIYLAVMCVLSCLINLFGVKWFGESEFFFSFIKIALITGLIIGGLAVSLGGGPNHDRIGFRYWKNPGPIPDYTTSITEQVITGPTGRFLSIISVLVQAAFSYQGMELVAIAASETLHPRRNIAKAVTRVTYRIIFFYICGIIVTGMLVAYNDPELLRDSGDASQSPYVIAFNNAGVKVLPHIINAGVFTSAFSAGNSFLYSTSRVLYGLSLRKQAPRFFNHCTKNGLPIYAVLVTMLFGYLSYLSVSSGANQVFIWLQNLTTIGGFFTWGTINLTYLRFYYGMKSQGIDRKKLMYWSRFQPWLGYWGLFWNGLIILISGFGVFFTGNFTAADFLTNYINVAIFFLLYVGWKLIRRTKIWKANEMDFFTGIPTVEETEGDYVPPSTRWQKFVDKVI